MSPLEKTNKQANTHTHKKKNKTNTRFLDSLHIGTSFKPLNPEEIKD